MKDSSQPTARTFSLVYRGAAGDIRLGPDAHGEYDKVLQLVEEADEIAVKRKAHIERYFREFCDNVDVQTNQTMLKNTALEIGELSEYRPRT